MSERSLRRAGEFLLDADGRQYRVRAHEVPGYGDGFLVQVLAYQHSANQNIWRRLRNGPWRSKILETWKGGDQ